MEDLIKLVSKQTGLSDDMAEKGVGMVRIRLALQPNQSSSYSTIRFPLIVGQALRG